MRSNTLSFSIKNWAAWAPGLNSKSDWAFWSQHPSLPTQYESIETTSIPPMLKRRCSHLSKMALELSNRALDNETIDYALFCSQHGEISRTVSLLKEIAEKEILSPTNFAQSVHNTSSGLFSVIHKMHQNMASIAAGNATFVMGMIEALSWLTLNPKKSVMITLFDEYLPEEYQSLKIQSNHQYAFSMILTKTHETLSLQREYSCTPKQENKLPQALEFLAWLLTPSDNELIQSSQHQTARWWKSA